MELTHRQSYPRTFDDSPEQHVGVPASARAARYMHPMDREKASIEGDITDGPMIAIVPITLHESFQPVTRRRLTRAQQRELAVKQAALRITAGLESRSLRTLARLIGCSHQAIDKAVLVMCERIGLRKFHVPDSTRQKLKAARARQLAGA